MKPTINCLLLSLICVTGFSQGPMYTVQGSYIHPVKKEKLENVETMSDLVAGYPSSWITDYISAEVTATINGKVVKAKGPNDVLNTEQKELLKMADLGTDIVVDVAYNRKNTVTGLPEMHIMHYTATLVPEIEAEYLGGPEQMKEYLKLTAMDKITEADSRQMKPALVKFTITEEGEIANVRIAASSGDKKIDSVLRKSILNMPKWRPAENANGIKVRQDFQFSVGNEGC